jgi:enamine deaminase RidA (YjgF/YER057c/UK114 family)
MQPSIQRIDSSTRLSKVVRFNGVLYLSGITAADRSQDIKGQTAQVLAAIDHYLTTCGASRNSLLEVQVILRHIDRDFAAFNAVWCDWLPEGHAPARATWAADLAADDVLVELIAKAADGAGRS